MLGHFGKAAAPLFRDIGNLAGGTTLGHLVLIGVSPLITRFITPAELGIFGTFTAYVAVVSVVASLGYEMGIPSASTRREALSLLMGVLLLGSSIALLFGVGLEVFILTAEQTVVEHWMPVGIVLVVVAANTVTGLQYWQIYRRDFRRAGLGALAMNSGRGSGHLIAAVLSGSAFSMAVADLMGRLVSLKTLKGDKVLPLGLRAVVRSPQNFWTILRRHKGLPVYQMPSAVLDVVLVWFPIPAIAAVYGVDSAGQFALLQRVTTAPSSLVGRALSDVFHQRAGLHRAVPRNLVRLTLGVLGLIAIVFVPVWLILNAFGRSLFQFVFGTEWVQAGGMAELFAPVIGLQIVASVMTRLLIVIGRQKLKLGFAVANLVLYMSVFALAAHMSLEIEEMLFVLVTMTALLHGLWVTMILGGLVREKPDSGSHRECSSL